MHEGAGQKNTRLTVGIATVGRGQVLCDTVDSAWAAMDPESMEMLVADQNIELDESTRLFLEQKEKAGVLRRIQMPKPSLTEARNAIVLQAAAPIVCFIDDDVKVPPGFFEAHLNGYRDPQVASVTGQVYHQVAGEPEADFADPDRGTVRHFIQEEAGPTDTSIGCNHSVRVSAVKDVGGYDAQFVAAAHCEDFDIIHRLCLHGFTGWYDPGAWLIHLRAPSGGCRVRWDSTQPEWTHTANLFLYAFRHGRRKGNFRSTVWKALRTGPGRREVVTHPLRWPAALWGLMRGVCYGFTRRKFTPCIP